jgi:hypothetical protein
MKLGPFTLTEKHWLKVFEYRVLRKLFGPEGGNNWEKFCNKGLHDFHYSPGIQVIKSRIIGGWGIWHIRRRGQMHIGFWRKKLKETTWKQLGTKCRII